MEGASLGRTSPVGLGGSVENMSVLTWEGEGEAFETDRSVETFLETMIDG